MCMVSNAKVKKSMASELEGYSPDLGEGENGVLSKKQDPQLGVTEFFSFLGLVLGGANNHIFYSALVRYKGKIKNLRQLSGQRDDMQCEVISTIYLIISVT